MSTSVVREGKSGITKFGTFHHLRTTNVMAAHKTVAWVSCFAVLRALDDRRKLGANKTNQEENADMLFIVHILCSFAQHVICSRSACWLEWFTTLHWEKGKVALRLEMTRDTNRCAYIGPVAIFFFSRTKLSERCLSLVQVPSMYFTAISRLKAL